MKISNVLLWLAVAGLAAFTGYTFHEVQQSKENAGSINISAGERIHIKDGNYQLFEKTLSDYDSGDKNGTFVNIRYGGPGSWKQDEGPQPTGSPFTPKDDPGTEPDGSMHVTQVIGLGPTSSMPKLKEVLDLLDYTGSGLTATPTPTP